MSINGVPPGANGPNRRKRCRIKGLIKKTIEQIEFYFSEPNLRRDLNFRKLAGSNGTKPVPIVQFLKFNKVAELTQDIQILRRAAYESKILKLCGLNSPFDQGAISRRDPAPPSPRDLKQKTVYIEGLPRDATIQWLNDLIVALMNSKPMFISLPRQSTGFSGGFAFIEFSSYSLAQKTVIDFNSRKAIATAFLLQSNRRKLFQDYLRRRQLDALNINVSTPLPPPIVRYLPELEKIKFFAQKPMIPKALVPDPSPANLANVNLVNNLNPPTQTNLMNPPTNPPIERKRRRDSENCDDKKPSKKTRCDENSIEKPGKVTDKDQINEEDSKKVEENPKNVDEIPKEVLQKVEEIPKRIETGTKKRKFEEEENVVHIEAEKRLKPDPTEKPAEILPNQEAGIIFKNPENPSIRLRRNSIPPLTGHVFYHGLNYWLNQPGTVSHSFNPLTPGMTEDLAPNGSSSGHFGKTKSTQTETSYPNSSVSYPNGISLERSISELVKKGRQGSFADIGGGPSEKKRRIPSTIQIANIKHKRKSRIRKRKKIQVRPRRTSSLFIPNWGGLKLRAMLASEWENLKKQYKSLQKQNMRKLKQSMKDKTFLYGGAALRKHFKHDQACANMSDDEDEDNQSATENENDFNQPEPINQPMVDPRGCRRSGQAPNYRHGVIVKIMSEGVLPSPDRLRVRFSDYGTVAYVDRTDEQNGFIRFNNQSGAQKSIEKESHFNLELLTGQSEENYWEFLLNQREKKRQADRVKLRGVERIVSKANRQRTKERKIHILFDSDLEADKNL